MCLWGYWNVGTLFRMRLEALLSQEKDSLTLLIEDIYRHLFYGNPYLPTGVYEVKETEVVNVEK